MADPAQAGGTSTLDLIGKLLDWPFLLFILTLILAKTGGKSILNLIANRKFEIEIGGNKLAVGDAVEALEEETTQDLKKLSERISALESRAEDQIERAEPTMSSPSLEAESPTAGSAPSRNADEVIFQRMLSALANSKLRWRTVERLALLAGVSEEKAHEILAAHHEKEVVLSRAKSGARIARLSSR